MDICVRICMNELCQTAIGDIGILPRVFKSLNSSEKIKLKMVCAILTEDSSPIIL